MKCVMITQINTQYICDILYHSNESMLRRASLLFSKLASSLTFPCLFDIFHFKIWSDLTRDLIACRKKITESQRRIILYRSQVTRSWRFWRFSDRASQYLTNLMHKICFTISFISCLYMFRAHVLIIRRSKLHYTASGIITHLTNLMHKISFTLSFISCLYMFRAHVLITRRSKLHYTASGIVTLIGVMIPEAV